VTEDQSVAPTMLIEVTCSRCGERVGTVTEYEEAVQLHDVHLRAACKNRDHQNLRGWD